MTGWRCFVTGTDTGVGKTHASLALLHQLRRMHGSAFGMKPVASGADQRKQGLRNADAMDLQSASLPRPEYDWVNPYCLREPTAPEIAAHLEQVQIDLHGIVSAYAHLSTLSPQGVVEGVGGWMAPLSAELMQADVARALGLPVVLVVGMRLGCISHGLLTARAIRADGLPLLGWIANDIDPDLAHADAYFDNLQQRLDLPCLGRLPHGHPAHLCELRLPT